MNIPTAEEARIRAQVNKENNKINILSNEISKVEEAINKAIAEGNDNAVMSINSIVFNDIEKKLKEKGYIISKRINDKTKSDIVVKVLFDETLDEIKSKKTEEE